MRDHWLFPLPFAASLPRQAHKCVTKGLEQVLSHETDETRISTTGGALRIVDGVTRMKAMRTRLPGSVGGKSR